MTELKLSEARFTKKNITIIAEKQTNNKDTDQVATTDAFLLIEFFILFYYKQTHVHTKYNTWIQTN